MMITLWIQAISSLAMITVILLGSLSFPGVAGFIQIPLPQETACQRERKHAFFPLGMKDWLKGLGLGRDRTQSLHSTEVMACSHLGSGAGCVLIFSTPIMALRVTISAS